VWVRPSSRRLCTRPTSNILYALGVGARHPLARLLRACCTSMQYYGAYHSLCVHHCLTSLSHLGKIMLCAAWRMGTPLRGRTPSHTVLTLPAFEKGPGHQFEGVWVVDGDSASLAGERGCVIAVSSFLSPPLLSYYTTLVFLGDCCYTGFLSSIVGFICLGERKCNGLSKVVALFSKKLLTLYLI